LIVRPHSTRARRAEAESSSERSVPAVPAGPYPGKSTSVMNGGRPGKLTSKNCNAFVQPARALVEAVPSVGLTPVSALSRLDLPQLDRPARAISGSRSRSGNGSRAPRTEASSDAPHACCRRRLAVLML
jgi:hypothetical protein